MELDVHLIQGLAPMDKRDVGIYVSFWKAIFGIVVSVDLSAVGPMIVSKVSALKLVLLMKIVRTKCPVPREIR